MGAVSKAMRIFQLCGYITIAASPKHGGDRVTAKTDHELLIHPFYMCLPSTLCVPGTVLGARDRQVSKIRQI